MTLSSETRWRPSPSSPSEAAAIALTTPNALRSMHGDLPARRVSGHAEVVLLPAAFSLSSLREAEFGHVPVLFIRPQHAIGEMATVGRIREGLRLEA